MINNSGLILNMRKLCMIESNSSQYTHITETVSWSPEKTAVIICDMWDNHWCKAAAARTAEIAVMMNQVVCKMRDMEVFVIHAPSDTMDYYKDFPGRKLALSAPAAKTAIPLQRWIFLDPSKEGELPIDDSDTGCSCNPRCNSEIIWTRQIDTIEVHDNDAIVDNTEAINLLKYRNIENVIIMGVHTNMCILGRAFGIRQLVIQGFNVALVRDMTDTMYNPEMKPYVDHFTGTDMVIGHVEKHWCPTFTSDQILGGSPFKFLEDKRS